MALVKCPECGHEVSDRANHCICCGFPLAVDKSVKLRLPRFCTGFLNQNVCEAELYIGDTVAWKGYCDSVITFEMEQACEVSVVIKRAWTGHIFPLFRSFTVVGVLQPGKKYETKRVVVSFPFGDPSKSKFVFSEVDRLDSCNG